MSDSAVPSQDDLVLRARGLLPLINSHAAWSEENRRLHDEVIEGMAHAGIFELRRPARYGGSEAGYGTQLDVIAELASADGSAGWNAAVWSIGNWFAGVFPDHVQDEVFATPDVRVCVVLSPTASAVPADGGLVVNGRWAFTSGAQHSHWQVVITMAPAPDGSQWPVAGLVPMSDLQVVDDWHTSGLAASGSVTTVANDVFVPQDKLIPMQSVLQSEYLSAANERSPVFTTPMIPTGAAGFVGVPLGMARAALASFLERLPGRKITFTDYSAQSAAPITHFQVSEAALKVDEAEFYADRMTSLLDRKGAVGEPWKLEERVRNRGWLGRLVNLSKESIDVLATASGGSSLYRSVPMQRIQRDMHAFSLHALMHPNTNFELYGRGLCGLEPSTMYL